MPDLLGPFQAARTPNTVILDRALRAVSRVRVLLSSFVSATVPPCIFPDADSYFGHHGEKMFPFIRLGNGRCGLMAT